MFYNKLIAAVTIIGSVLPTAVFAQHTKGGSKKSYDKYRYTTEMQVTQREVNNNPYKYRKQSYFYFSVGPAISMSSNFTGKPITPYFDTPYADKDGMGGSIGGSFNIGGNYAFKKLNNKIIPLIDVSLLESHTFTIHPYSWSSAGGIYTSDVSFKPFWSLSNFFAPMVTINPLYKDNNRLHIDVGYRLGGAVIFGGGQSSSYYDYAIARENFLNPVFCHGPTFRLRYSALYVGIEINLIKDNTEDGYGYDYSTTTTNYVGTMPSYVNLSNFSFTIGVASF